MTAKSPVCITSIYKKHERLKNSGDIFSIFSLLSCGHGNKRAAQNDGVNSNAPLAVRITKDKLPEILKTMQAGKQIMILRVSAPMTWTASVLCKRTENFIWILKLLVRVIFPTWTP